MKNKISKLLKRKISFSDILYYIQGNLRYRIYYSIFKHLLIRKYILEQIDYRIDVMNKECYNTGSCIKCGCATTALQMCNKSCEGMCYPPMETKFMWNSKMPIHISNTRAWLWNFKSQEYNLYIKQNTGTYVPAPSN